MMKTSKQVYRMPKICWSTLNAFRRKLHSSIPKDQDDFVSTILDKIEFKFLTVTNGRWKDIMLGEFLADNPVATCMDNDNNFGLSSDGSWWSTSVSCMVSPHE